MQNPSKLKKKSDEQLIIEAAIERGDQGFRGGWIEVAKVAQLTGLSGASSTVGTFLVQMGYKNRGKVNIKTENNCFQASVYHKDEKIDRDMFLYSNGYMTDPYQVIENAVEQSIRGFRGGWIEASALAEILKIKQLSPKHLRCLKSMGYQSLGSQNIRINKMIVKKTLYGLPDRMDDFWTANGYERQSELPNPITNRTVGFMNDWADVSEGVVLTGLSSREFIDILKRAGYVKIGRSARSINSKKITKSLYNINANADVNDFWKTNGYE